MNSEINSNISEVNNDSAPTKRETGYYWVRIDEGWFITKYYSQEDLFYLPGYFDCNQRSNPAS
jgi:hypothetical protein